MTAWISVILGIISVMLVPLIVFIWRGAVKWTRVEDKLDGVIRNVADLVRNEDKIHQTMIDQMKEDRRATNERLTWLERNLWNRGS